MQQHLEFVKNLMQSEIRMKILATKYVLIKINGCHRRKKLSSLTKDRL